MKLIAIGSNLPHPPYHNSLALCQAALSRFSHHGLTVISSSRWYDTTPMPPSSDQPRFINGVCIIETHLTAYETLAACLTIEREFGRIRSEERWVARTLDLDVISWGQEIIDSPNLRVPHPEMAGRGFVLVPLADVAPGWRHPEHGVSVEALVAALPEADMPQPVT